MKRLLFVISVVIFSTLLICISNAKVVRKNEYVTKREVRQYLASMSEALEALIDPYQNPSLLRRLESNESLRKIKEEMTWKDIHSNATRSNGIK